MAENNPDVLVVGSCNYDLTIQTDRLPGPSETLLGGGCLGFPGGKGANQALGLERLGSPVRFLTRIGRDHYGREILGHLRSQDLDVSRVTQDPSAPTGVALITLDRVGTRSIVVAPGANNNLSETHVDSFLREAPSGALLVTQLEIPVDTVAHLLRSAKRHDLRTVLNASPAVPFPPELLRLVDVLVLNQSELHLLSGRSAQHLETATSAAELLLAEGSSTILVTMGLRGVLVVHPAAGGAAQTQFIPGFKVAVKDSNVASSAFIAGVVHHLSRAEGAATGERWTPARMEQAVSFGLSAMAVSLSRSGGQASLPTGADVESFITKSREPVVAGPEGDADHERLKALAERANAIRRRIIRMLYAARSGHPGGSLSIAELLSVLYFHTMVYNPKQPDWPNRDRLVLSKGHAAPALYATLIEAGFLDAKLETELRKLGSPLQGHPDRKRCPGVEMSTGSLGQGLSVANGMALAARHTNRSYRVYCIMGDGEVQEGQVWEAAMTSAHYRLDNLCAVVDYNALQIDGSIGQVKSPIEPLPDKWKAFGWNVLNVDGHDIADLCQAFDAARQTQGKPTMLVAHTIKGHGVSFMEGVIEYHGSTLSDDEVRRALAELEASS
jgi:transketolase